VLIEGGGNLFDMKIEIGDEIYVSVILPTVDFAEHSIIRGRDDEFCS
jgi:hypothetical protein